MCGFAKNDCGMSDKGAGLRPEILSTAANKLRTSRPTSAAQIHNKNQQTKKKQKETDIFVARSLSNVPIVGLASSAGNVNESAPTAACKRAKMRVRDASAAFFNAGDSFEAALIVVVWLVFFF